jgi:hypothetical protein
MLAIALFRLIAVESMKQAAWSATASTPAGASTLNETRAFRTHSVQLGMATGEINRLHGLPAVVVLVRGEVTMRRKGTETVRLDQSNRWIVVPAGDSYTLVAPAVGDVQLVEIEVR